VFGIKIIPGADHSQNFSGIRPGDKGGTIADMLFDQFGCFGSDDRLGIVLEVQIKGGNDNQTLMFDYIQTILFGQ